MTTGAHEVTTVDELQHPSLLGGGDGGGTLTPRVCVNSSRSFIIIFCWEEVKVEDL